MLKRILYLIVLITFVSCQEQLNEKVVDTFDDGRPSTIHYFKTVKGEAVLVSEKMFYPNSNIRQQGDILDSARHGLWISYFENGNKWAEAHYDKGVENGLHTAWYENGNRRYQGEVENGDRVGEWQFWSENGELIKSINYSE